MQYKKIKGEENKDFINKNFLKNIENFFENTINIINKLFNTSNKKIIDKKVVFDLLEKHLFSGYSSNKEVVDNFYKGTAEYILDLVSNNNTGIEYQKEALIKAINNIDIPPEYLKDFWKIPEFKNFLVNNYSFLDINKKEPEYWIYDKFRQHYKADMQYTTEVKNIIIKFVNNLSNEKFEKIHSEIIKVLPYFREDLAEYKYEGIFNNEEIEEIKKVLDEMRKIQLNYTHPNPYASLSDDHEFAYKMAKNKLLELRKKILNKKLNNKINIKLN